MNELIKFNVDGKVYCDDCPFWNPCHGEDESNCPTKESYPNRPNLKSDSSPTYYKQGWLYTEGSESIGTVAAYHGTYGSVKKDDVFTWLEISDGWNKIILRKTDMGMMSDYITKMRILSSMVNEFADYLETIKEN